MTPQTLAMAEQLLPWVQRLPVGTDDRVRLVIARAILDLVAVLEEPLGSNRGWMIDEYLQRSGLDQAAIAAGKGYWCAAAVGAWYEDAGLVTPKGRASCDRWMEWAKATGRWSQTPALGAAVLYGKPGDAQHIGLVVRLQPLVLSIEGNTTIESGFSRNGVAVAVKVVDRQTDPILGYCLPFEAPSPRPLAA